MKGYALCPISDTRINEQIARLNAAFTFLILLSFLITQDILIIVFLVIDFIIRAIPYSKYSPVNIISKNIARYLSLGEKLINAGPKIFAARIGSFMSALIIAAKVLSFTELSWILAGVLLLFSFLEAALGFCVACKLYPLIYKLLYKQDFQEP